MAELVGMEKSRQLKYEDTNQENLVIGSDVGISNYH